MDIIFNTKQVEMGRVTFLSTQHNLFIKRVKWVGSGQPASLTGRVNVESFSWIPLPWHDTNPTC